MNVFLTQGGTFNASHSHGGTLAEENHPHTFSYEVTFYGPLNDEGYLLDFREVQKVLAEIVGPLQNQNLNSFFTHPTTEHIAMWIYNQTAKKLPYLRNVRVKEEPDRWIQVGEP